MNVDTKFELGDKAWYVKDVRTRVQPDCNVCKNEREIKVEGRKKKYPCPECTPGGHRKVIMRGDFVAKRTRKITQIDLSVTKRTTKAQYYAGDHWLEENEIYRTEAEAKKEAARKIEHTRKVRARRRTL